MVQMQFNHLNHRIHPLCPCTWPAPLPSCSLSWWKPSSSVGTGVRGLDPHRVSGTTLFTAGGSSSKNEVSSAGCIFIVTWIILMCFLMHGTFMLSEQQFCMIWMRAFHGFLKMVLKAKRVLVWVMGKWAQYEKLSITEKSISTCECNYLNFGKA